MIETLIRLAQKLDDLGVAKETQMIDCLIAKIADDKGDVFQKEPKKRPSNRSNISPWEDVGFDPIGSHEKFEITDLPEVMQPKVDDAETQEDTVTIESDESFEDLAASQHVIALDKKYLLEDISEEVANFLESKPLSIVDKSLASTPHIRLVFENGMMVISVHSNEDQVWLDANSFFGGKTNQLKFPLNFAKGGGVSQEELATMAQRIAIKIESFQNS